MKIKTMIDILGIFALAVASLGTISFIYNPDEQVFKNTVLLLLWICVGKLIRLEK